MGRRLRTAPLALVLIVATVAPVSGGGSYLGDPGGQANQRAGAFVALADDASALWHNPAGLARLGAGQLVFALSLVGFRQRFTRAGAYADSDRPWAGERYPTVTHRGRPQPVPLLVGAVRAGAWTLAAGLLAPQGHGARDYPGADERGAPAPQRYDTIEQRALIALPSIGVGFGRGRLRLGARLSWGVAQLHSRSASQGLGVPDEDPDYDVLATIDAADRFVPGAGVGVQLTLGRGVELGAAWTSPLPVRARGTTRSQLGPAVDAPPLPLDPGEARCGAAIDGALAACVDFDLPQTATIGARKAWRDRRGAERADLELDVRWENWSAAADQRLLVDGRDRVSGERLPAVFSRHGLHDSWSIRLGTSRAWTTGSRGVTTRAGVAWDSAAAPASWRRLDLDAGARLTVALGAAIRIGRIAIELGIARVISPAQQVDDVAVAPGAPRAQPDVPVPLAPSNRQPYHPYNAGRYQSAAWILATGMTVSW